MSTAIHIEHIFKNFGQEQILSDVSHDFEQGKIHGIVGNNGSGKTVLMKCICGFLIPTKGKILVQDKQVGKDMDFPQDLGLIIETPGFLPQLSGMNNLKLLASLKRKISEEIIKDTLKLVGLDPDMKKPVSKYSLGMRQRLGIAQAIMEDPSLLILDEPFNGLDKKGIADIRALLQDLKTKGKTIILASHNAQDIDLLCDTVCEMDSGVLTVIR
ncbi:ATP-binding cassette domain-containing protein [Clostridium paridis]|uniref:ATP-binding cassette domain-containing protein n=1 Tax=Clostridium paridis TaxID=2803863 RepID=A0A937FGR8_9CLOT|nr:ATP-binding cassette domain-containing protein [Clostridium paridis]MBL4933650.1 ATP-binding cassette domain-containing protein [Clostridium paridis]